MTILDFGGPFFWTIHMGLPSETGDLPSKKMAIMGNMISEDHRIQRIAACRRTCQFLGDSDEEEGF